MIPAFRFGPIPTGLCFLPYPQVSFGLPVYWRKLGPMDWIKVIHTQFPGDPWWDGGATGASVQFSDLMPGGNQGFRQRTWFIIAKDPKDFEKRMRECYRWPVGEKRPKPRGSYFWRPWWAEETHGLVGAMEPVKARRRTFDGPGEGKQ